MKLKSCYHNFQYIFFYCFIHFFSYLLVHYFPFNKFFLIYFKNKNRWILSLAVPCFVFNVNWRKSKHILFLIFNTKSTSKTSKNIFSLKIKLSQVSVIVFSDWQLLCQVSKKWNSASNDILILGKLFHIYKLIHID